MISFRERFLEALPESAIDCAMTAMDQAGLVTARNAGAQQVPGWNEEEILGLPADVIFCPADRAAGVSDAERRTARQHARSGDERWHVKNDETSLWADGELVSPHDEAGVLQGFVRIVRDRTDQRLAAEQQRADAEFMREVLSASADCIKVLDVEGRLVFNERRRPAGDGGDRFLYD